MFAVIAENDESQWDDEPGVLYHFPKRYREILAPGTQVLYYKGKIKDAGYSAMRLSAEPHYFGTALIGKVYPDSASKKGDLFALIQGFEKFAMPVALKADDGQYFEAIPENRKGNYWRDGVRVATAETYLAILAKAGVARATSTPEPAVTDDELESYLEGSKTQRYVTTYERDSRYRQQALAIHGLKCKACDVDMGERYGGYAHGLIHVHHVVPVSTYEAPKPIDPATDLVPVCPNCHAVIHRKKTATLSIFDVRQLLGKTS
jgi:predicted HNH restriction endonuclease